MNVKELMEYLSGFRADQPVSALILNLETRQAYKVGGYQLMTDTGFPVLLFELGDASPMDDMVEEAGKEEGK